MTVLMTDVMQVIHRYQHKGFSPRIGMILGSGLSSLSEQIENSVTIPYQAIPGLQVGTVAGHASLMLMGNMGGVPVVCMRGRLHVYEGTPYDSIRIFVRLMKHMGCHALVITGAVGSMLPNAGPGELVMVTDHINFQPGNPLVGHNDESEGPRFFGMEDAYDPGLQDIMQSSANNLGIQLHRGVYISTLGPCFETPAEIRAFRTLGADVVGMSVVPEVLVARHCGLRVACVTAVTNYAAGMSNERITHEGTLHFGEIAARNLTKLIPQFVKEASNAVD
ncbi:MAG TPA: purine-nucleoside phosphorylase [Gammaproteobacteria bacterium]|nr:purine-nucleoside phosphorylase [Gammaproteobacteria bacterium]